MPGTHVVMDGKLIRSHCNSSRSKTYHGDQWVTIEVEVHGNGITRSIVEGETVFEFSKPQLDEKDADARKLIKDGDKMLYVTDEKREEEVRLKDAWGRGEAETVKEGKALHMERQADNWPEIVLNLFCHGPIERRVSASSSKGALCSSSARSRPP